MLNTNVVNNNVTCRTTDGNLPVVVGSVGSRRLSLNVNRTDGLLNGVIRHGGVAPTGVNRALDHVHPALGCNSFTRASVIVRTIMRGPGIGHTMLGRMRNLMGSSYVLTSGASAVSVAFLTRTLRHPRGFINVRFFGPMDHVPLIRIVHNRGSSRRTVSAAITLTAGVNGIPMIIGSYPNFLMGHILFPCFNTFSLLLGRNTSFTRISGIVRGFN